MSNFLASLAFFLAVIMGIPSFFHASWIFVFSKYPKSGQIYFILFIASVLCAIGFHLEELEKKDKEGIPKK